MFEYEVVQAGGRNPKEMAEAISAALELAAKDGWEPINFTPIGYRVGMGDPENAASDPILNYRLGATATQIIFRRTN